LQPGALLSTAHTLTLLRSAAAGDKFVSKLVIDGSFGQGLFWVTAVIAPAHEGGVWPVKDDKNTLGQGRYWPVGMAYFPVSSKRETPEYEISQNLLGNGIMRSMMQNFGGFTLAFAPIKMEAVNAPLCS
jgi:EipB-like